MFEDFVLPSEVSQELDVLLEMLDAIPEIKRFKAIERAVKENHYLHDTEELIKDKQKEAAHLAHYGKWEAKKVIDREIDQLRQELEENVTVTQYRQALREVNQILQQVMDQLYEEVVRPIDENQID